MRKALRTSLLSLTIVGGLTGTALATPSVGFSPTILSRATLQESVNFNTGEVKFQTKGPVDITHQTINIAPDATSGWHSHPGVVLVTVRSGSVRRLDADCSSEVYSAGQAFTESGRHPGEVRNESPTAPAVVDVTYITPVGAALRVDELAPRCAG